MTESWEERLFRDYEGPEKPCKYCGSTNVKYLVRGNGKRLGCFNCDQWLGETEDANREDK